MLALNAGRWMSIREGKKIMRPGPATRAAWGAKCPQPACLTATLSSGRALGLHRTPQSTSPSAPLWISRSTVTDFLPAVQSRPLETETMRRPQRPGKPARVAAFLETLQQFTLGNRWKLLASSRCSSRRFRRIALACRHCARSRLRAQA
jgi:hypothetical protein